MSGRPGWIDRTVMVRCATCGQVMRARPHGDRIVIDDPCPHCDGELAGIDVGGEQR